MYDLDEAGALVPADRQGPKHRGRRRRHDHHAVAAHPDGVTRVIVLGDPTEVARLARRTRVPPHHRGIGPREEMAVPLEWYALSSGAAVEMDSGTENLDWVAAALKRIVEFTQDGHEINIVVTGINVGGQAYWNAEATMLMHTRVSS